MYFKCYDCGNVFEEPDSKIEYDYYPFGSTSCRCEEYVSVCPWCKSEEIDETTVKDCNDDVSEDCEDCIYCKYPDDPTSECNKLAAFIDNIIVNCNEKGKEQCSKCRVLNYCPNAIES